MNALIQLLEEAGFSVKNWKFERLYINQSGRNCGYIDIKTKSFIRCSGAPRMSSETIRPIVEAWK